MNTHQPHHDSEADWTAKVSAITEEGEVLMPYLTEAISWIAAICRDDGLEVRRVIDIGSGPGVGTCALAQEFDAAVVTAVDGSSEMLASTAARSEAFGVISRVRTKRADLPAGLDDLEPADLLWMAMVLHHVSDPLVTLGKLRALLDRGGILAIAEFGDPPSILSDTLRIGHSGLFGRLRAAAGALSASSIDYRETIEAAGFELIADRVARVRLGPPLTHAAHRVALRYLGRTRQLLSGSLSSEDQALLDDLIDGHSPLGIAGGKEAVLDVSRRIYVARAAAAQ